MTELAIRPTHTRGSLCLSRRHHQDFPQYRIRKVKVQIFPVRTAGQGCSVGGRNTHTHTDGHKIIRLVIHELLLFRFNSFQLLVLHISTVPVSQSDTSRSSPMHTENREIEKYAKRRQKFRDLRPSPAHFCSRDCCLP